MKNKKKFWIIGVIASLAMATVIIIFIMKKSTPQYSPYNNPLTNISINGEKFKIEEVSTPEKAALGLSGRESMCEKCGMLFVFGANDYRGFWMKDMKFDLDIIWISGDRVVYLAKNLSYEKGMAESVVPEAKADKVLEINAGMSDKIGIKIGDEVNFSE